MNIKAELHNKSTKANVKFDNDSIIIKNLSGLRVNKVQKQQIISTVSSARDQKIVADIVFDFLAKRVNPRAMYFIQDPLLVPEANPLYFRGDYTPVVSFPETFWRWASQFDTSENLIPLEINTCAWNYQDALGGECYIMMFDNHHDWRTYLFVEAVDPKCVEDQCFRLDLDVLNFVASRWQCLRAERDAAREFKNRDIREAKYLDEIRSREQFIEQMKMIQQVAVGLSNPPTLDELYLGIVEAMRNQLGFDRSVFMLLDLKKRCFTGTYGTNESGETISEYHTIYDIHQLEEQYIEALYSPDENLVIIEDAPLYSSGSVVGQGWNGMLILRDGDDAIGWVAFDNFIRREPISKYDRGILRSLGSLMSQIYIRKRQEQNMRLLHSSMVELSRCTTLSEVCRSAVDFAIHHLGIDRLAVFLTDSELTQIHGTWGTDIQGNVVDESYYKSEVQYDRPLVSTAIAQPNEISFEDSVPIYHDKRIVGNGWTAMTLLKSSTEGPIAFIAADNLLSRKPLTSQLQELMLLFASNLTEVLQRTKAQESIRNLNENLEREVKRRTLELEQANQQLELLSNIDPLTRLGNRRQLSKLMDNFESMPNNVSVGFGLILLDIDFFGLFNNAYGHLEGDITLIRIGNILSGFCKTDEESFCRIGGEEFALLLSGTTEKNTSQLAEKIRHAIEKEAIAHNQNPPSNLLTVSVGYYFASTLPKSFDFETMYSKADDALYEAKSAGRNRVMGSSEACYEVSC